MICCSPAPINVDGSTSQRMTSTSESVCSATFTIYSQAYSSPDECPAYQKHNLSALHIRIHGLDAVSGRLRLVRRDSNLLTDQMIHQRRFSPFGLPIIVTNPDLKLSFIVLPRFCTVFPAPHQVRLSSVSNICFSDVSTSSLPITHTGCRLRAPTQSKASMRGCPPAVPR